VKWGETGLVLVDSSVWIDYLGHSRSKVAQKLEFLIRSRNRVAITGFIFQEVLQGIRNSRSCQLTQKLLRRFPFLMPTLDTHLRAAEIFHEISYRGIKPKSAGTLIAALAIEHRVQLFSLDHDFVLIAKHTSLNLFS